MFHYPKPYSHISLCGLLFLNINDVFAESNTLGYENKVIHVEAGLRAGYDSNLYDSFSDRVGSTYYQPSLDTGLKIGGKTLGLISTYKFDAFIPESRNDIAKSNHLILNGHWSPSIRNTFSISTSQNIVDEKRGTGLTEDIPFSVEELDSYTFNTIEYKYNFINPRQESIFLTLSYDVNTKEYDSQRSTALNANLDQNRTLFDFGYQWTINKKIYIELNNIDQDYPDVNDSSQNSINFISAVGLDWKLTSAFDIFAIVGEEQKDFDNSGRSSYKTDYWNLALAWSPLTRTQFLIESKNEQEPLTEANQTFNEVSTLSLNLIHNWSSDYKSLIQVSREKTHSIVNNINDIEEEELFSISTYYRDLALTLTWENEKDNSQNFSQFSIALTYTLKGGF